MSQQNDNFYTYYPELFSAYFKLNNDTIIKQLSKAGFLYYEFILAADRIVDDHISSQFFEMWENMRKA